MSEPSQDQSRQLRVFLFDSLEPYHQEPLRRFRVSDADANRSLEEFKDTAYDPEYRGAPRIRAVATESGPPEEIVALACAYQTDSDDYLGATVVECWTRFDDCTSDEIEAVLLGLDHILKSTLRRWSGSTAEVRTFWPDRLAYAGNLGSRP